MRNGVKHSGAIVNGGIGPDWELGVELPEEGVDVAGALPLAERLADLAIVRRRCGTGWIQSG